MATLKYFAQKTTDGYPIPSTMMGFKETPTPDTLVEIEPKEYQPLAGQSVSAPDSELRYFVRHKPNGDIIPNSLITTIDRPEGLVYEFKVITGSVVVAPSALSYPTPNSFDRNVSIEPLSPTVTGTVTSYSVSPALPAGLSLNTTTGVISGTPTNVQAATNYTVTASNIAGSRTAIVSIEVLVIPV